MTALGIALLAIGYSLFVAAVCVFMRIGPLSDRRAEEMR